MSAYDVMTLPASFVETGDLMIVAGTTYQIDYNRFMLTRRLKSVRQIWASAVNDSNDHLNTIKRGSAPIRIMRPVK